MTTQRFILLCGIFFAAFSIVSAQTQPATTPTTKAEPRRIVVPAGFGKKEIGGRTFVVQPADEAWVRTALDKLAPTTLPTTMPADVQQKIDAVRADLVKQMQRDLALADTKAAENFLKSDLEPIVKQYGEFNPPLVYFVATKSKVKELLKGGWSDPRFYYNRAADDIQLTGAIQLSLEESSDDIVLPMVYEDTTTVEMRNRLAGDLVHMAEAQIAQRIATQTLTQAQSKYIDFMIKNVLAPLNLKTDQEWLSVGIAGVLSAKYVSLISGIDNELLMRGVTSDDPSNPIRSATIDLVNRTPISEMRPQAVPAYFDAFRRKSARVVLKWVQQSGEDAIPKTITALRAQPAADGAALLTTIKAATGADLSADLKAN